MVDKLPKGCCQIALLSQPLECDHVPRRLCTGGTTNDKQETKTLTWGKRPMPQTLRILFSPLCVTAIFLMLISCSPKRQIADHNFDTKVAHPAYVNEHPKVLFDEAHKNIHTMRGGYEPFTDLASNDGYHVTANKEAFSEKTLNGIRVLSDSPRVEFSQDVACSRQLRSANMILERPAPLWSYGFTLIRSVLR